MVEFAVRDGALIAEGHDHDDDELRVGVAAALAADRSEMQAQSHAASARLSEAWWSDEGGFGHDCGAHADVDKRLWGLHCGTFRPVTVAEDIPVPARVERVQRDQRVLTVEVQR